MTRLKVVNKKHSKAAEFLFRGFMSTPTNEKDAQRRPFITRGYYSMILATTPAPTVRPPSRIAKRKPSSIAIG